MILEIVVIALISYRLWRVIGKDTLTEPLRDRMHPFIREGTECAWCLGTYVTLIVTCVAWLSGFVEYPVIVGVAATTIVGLMSNYD